MLNRNIWSLNQSCFGGQCANNFLTTPESQSILIAHRLTKQPPQEEPHLKVLPSTSSNTSMNNRKLKLDNNENWVASAYGVVPLGAIQGGNDINGEPLYIARAEYEGSLTPGKLNCYRCYIPWGSAERQMDHCEVLCNLKGKWVQSKQDRIPKNALKSGYSETGETLYIGRAKHLGRLTPGKVHPSHKLCYICFDGEEIGYECYEIFCC